jgi:membrane-associated phospholipid phosphatase
MADAALGEPLPSPPLGLTHPHFTAASAASLAALVALLACPPLHARARSVLRPAVLARVHSGLTAVAWFQARRTPALTAFFGAASATVSVPFYVLALPALQWCGSPRLGARLSLALGAALYVGNALKDLVCAPRPLGLVVGGGGGGGGGEDGGRADGASRRRSPRTRLPPRAASAPNLAASATAGGPQTITTPGGGDGTTKPTTSSEAVSAREYGLPSSHVMNTAVLLFYAGHYGLGHTVPGREWVASHPVAAPVAVYSAAAAWTAVVAAARLYAGMHTPVDVGSGLVAGLAVFSAWTALDEAYEAFLLAGDAPGSSGVTHGAAVVGAQAAASALLLRLHPRPLRHTPSYEASATFLGACAGVALGLWRSGGRHLTSGGWGSLPHGAGGLVVAATAAGRLCLGFATAAAVHLAAKAAILALLPLAYAAVPLGLRRLWQPPLHSLARPPPAGVGGGRRGQQHNSASASRWEGIPLNARGLPWDVAITARFLSYAALGWAVSDLAFGVMGVVEAGVARRWGWWG